MRYSEILNEVTLPNNIFTKAVKYLIKNIEWDGLEKDNILHELGYSDDDEIDVKSKQFKTDLLGWAERRVYEAFDEIDFRFKGNVIRAYRCITAPENWNPKLQHPGIYWSWDEDAAEAHWGHGDDGHIDWVMEADLNFSQIDWIATLAMSASPSFDIEKEIRILKDSPVKIVKYYQK